MPDAWYVNIIRRLLLSFYENRERAEEEGNKYIVNNKFLETKRE